jgi:hypothetical protein
MGLFRKIEKVNLFMIGEQKCGTSSLHELLVKNKDVLGGRVKECQYFNTDRFTADTGYKAYHEMFKQVRFNAPEYRIDSTPDYLHSSLVAERVHQYNPDSKLIIVLRDPTARFISAYNFYFSNILRNLDSIKERYLKYSENGLRVYDYLKQRGELSLSEFVNDEINGVSPINALERGKYAVSIEAWLKHFPKSACSFLFFEHLKRPESVASELKILEKFLQLELSTEFPRENVSLKKETPEPALKQKLNAFYKEHEPRLVSLIERELPWAK